MHPPDIFISYAREDEAWVRPLAVELERSGRTVFWDRRIPTGKDWRSHIGTALEQARCVVVVWSRDSITAKFVLEEADEGRERDVLFPVFRHPVRPPLGFRGIHAADLSAWSPGGAYEPFDIFLADLAEMLGLAPAPETPAQQKPASTVGDEPRTSRPTKAADATTTASSANEERSEQRPPPAPSTPARSDADGPQTIPVPEAASPTSATDGRQAHTRPRFISPGDVFRDLEAAWCPELVVIPSGSFTMGSPSGGWFRSGEVGRSDDEGPQRQVTFARQFALGRHTVTRGQFANFVDATGHDMSGGARARTGKKWQLLADRDWRSPGFAQTDAHPVVCVSWLDARAYVAWLAERTGQPYRLPTEAEWEYAARAGTTTPFWTGATISTAQANYDGNYTYGSGVKGIYRQGTVVVDDLTFPANSFGLYHVHGNVWEWTQDAYRKTYDDAPMDGSKAVDDANAPERVLRGGSWNVIPRGLRSADRYGDAPDYRGHNVGFRVARMLTP